MNVLLHTSYLEFTSAFSSPETNSSLFIYRFTNSDRDLINIPQPDLSYYIHTYVAYHPYSLKQWTWRIRTGDFSQPPPVVHARKSGGQTEFELPCHLGYIPTFPPGSDSQKDKKGKKIYLPFHTLLSPAKEKNIHITPRKIWMGKKKRQAFIRK